MTLKEELDNAKQEIGEEEFNKRFRTVFDIPCLDYVKTIVINLPEPCYADCDYCIDKKLRNHTIDNETFLRICEVVLREFPNCKEVSISGGSLNAKDFNKLIYLIKSYFPNSILTWNTNGVCISEEYLPGIDSINYINLHRNSANDKINKEIFRTSKDIINVEDAKKLMGKSLSIRVTVDENFDLEEYTKLGSPLNLNRLLPGDKKSDAKFNEVAEKLQLGKKTLVNYICKKIFRNFHIVNAIICDVVQGDKQSDWFMNDISKLFKFDDGVIIFDRGLCGIHLLQI